jgi:hypothetical protein
MPTCSRNHGPSYIGALLSIGLVVTGCSLFSGVSKMHHSAKGSVYLKEIADWSFEASHPALLDETTMLKVMKGVVADDATRGATKVPASGGKPMRMFSDEDAEFLAPLLAQALSQARPEQLIGFRVSPSAGSGAEPAAGTLYVQQGFIYLTITSSQSRKPSGFAPSAAARLERAAPYAAAGTPEALSLVIDHQALTKPPMIVPTSVAAEPPPPPVYSTPATSVAKTPPKPDSPVLIPSPATSISGASDSISSQMSNDELLSKKLDELRQARESNKLKESEIAMLKKEITWLKQELRDRTAEIQTMKAGKVSRSVAPKRKTAEARPIR